VCVADILTARGEARGGSWIASQHICDCCQHNCSAAGRAHNELTSATNLCTRRRAVCRLYWPGTRPVARSSTARPAARPVDVLSVTSDVSFYVSDEQHASLSTLRQRHFSPPHHYYTTISAADDAGGGTTMMMMMW